MSNIDGFVKEWGTNNPFIHNYVFKDSDIERCKVNRWQYPLLFFLPTYVQITDHYVIIFKQWMNRYFIVGHERLRDD